MRSYGQYCSIARGLDVIGDRWTLLIVRDAILGMERFEEFQADLGIASNVLTNRLQLMCDEGVLARVGHAIGHTLQAPAAWNGDDVSHHMLKLDRHELLRSGAISTEPFTSTISAARPVLVKYDEAMRGYFVATRTDPRRRSDSPSGSWPSRAATIIRQ